VPSLAPRTGTDSTTGISTSAPGSGEWNAINGRERIITEGNDLQYACVFELPAPKDCSVTTTACDCVDQSGGQDNPLCRAPDGTFGSTQYRAKAYPTPRVLSVLQGLGARAVVGSICAPELTDPTSAAYGYRPAVRALLEAMRPSLR
jgi:hypothetical protein